MNSQEWSNNILTLISLDVKSLGRSSGKDSHATLAFENATSDHFDGDYTSDVSNARERNLVFKKCESTTYGYPTPWLKCWYCKGDFQYSKEAMPDTAVRSIIQGAYLDILTFLMSYKAFLTMYSP